MKRTFLSITLCVFALPLMAVNTSAELMRTAVGYKLAVNGMKHEVKSYDVDSRLRFLDQSQLIRLAQVGFLKAHQMSNGDYRVEIGGGLKGGGPVAGFIGYWGTKAVCYGAAIGGATATVVATAGAAGPLVAGGVTLASAGASTGTAVVAAVVGTSAAATEAAGLAVGAAVTGAGGAAGAIAAVESSAAFIGSALLVCPWLP